MLNANTIKSIESKLTLNRALMHTVLLGLVFLLGIALRFYDLGSESYWMDEITMVEVAGGSLHSIAESARGGRPPVYVVTAHFWMQVFGDSEVATRSLSAVMGVLALGVMYVLGRELFDRNIGLIGTFIMAISEFQIYHAQNFRYYIMFVLFTLVSFLYFTRFLCDGRRRDLIFYGLASVLMYYTHTFGIFVLFAQNLCLVLQWRRYWDRWRPWIVSQIVVGISVAISLVSAIGKTTAGDANVMNWIPEYPLYRPLITIYKHVFPARDVPSLATMAIAFLFLIVGTGLFVRWQGRRQWFASLRGFAVTVRGVWAAKSSALILLGCWVVGCMLVPFGLSKIFGPLYIDRYTISVAPALFLLIAVAIAAVGKIVPQIVSLGMLVILIAPGLHEYYVTDVKEQWHEVAAYIEAHEQPGDVIVFAPNEKDKQQKSLRRYYEGNLPGCGLHVKLQQPVQIADGLARCTAGSERFWLVLRGGERRAGHLKDFFLNSNHSTMRMIDEAEFTGISLRLFELTDQR